MWVWLIEQLAISLGWVTDTHASYLYTGLDDHTVKWATQLKASVHMDLKKLGEVLVCTFMLQAPTATLMNS